MVAEVEAALHMAPAIPAKKKKQKPVKLPQITPYEILESKEYDKRRLQYLIRVTKDDLEPSWVRQSQLEKCPDLVLDFHLSHPESPRPYGLTVEATNRVQAEEVVYLPPTTILDSTITLGRLEYLLPVRQAAPVFNTENNVVKKTEFRWNRWIPATVLEQWPKVTAEYHCKYPARPPGKACSACVSLDVGLTDLKAVTNDLYGGDWGDSQEVLLKFGDILLSRAEVAASAEDGLCLACPLLLRGINAFAPEWEFAEAYFSEGAIVEITVCKFQENTGKERTGPVIQFYTIDGRTTRPTSTDRSRISNRFMMPKRILRKHPDGTGVREELNFQASRIQGLARDVSEDFTVAEPFDLMKTWYNSCLDSHTDCRLATRPQSADVPARMLRIGPGPEQLALYQVSDPRAAYAALSHCWGTTLHLSTTLSTLEDRLAGVDWEALPKTYQDAVVVARHLGLGYLWIDSLCIVQDSPEDWQIESRKMGAIYQNAEVVIAAAWALDGSHGCFNSRLKPEILPGCAIDNVTRIHVRKALDHSYFISNLGKSINKKNGLYNRGWCFQERFLARRVIHFGQEEMVWECANGISCECGALCNIPGNDIQQRYASLTRGNESADPVALRQLWFEIIKTYTWKNLTYFKDILPALSGLAAQLAPHISESYTAGLWEGDIRSARGLLWYSKASLNKRAEAATGPSWSWCSVEGPVDFIEQNTGPTKVSLEILSIRSQVSTLNPYGSVDGASLIVRGLVLQVSFLKLDDNNMNNLAFIKADSVKTAFTCHMDDMQYASQIPSGSPLMCLMVLEDCKSYGYGDCRALLLEKCSADVCDNTVRRVGVLQYFSAELENLNQRTITIV